MNLSLPCANDDQLADVDRTGGGGPERSQNRHAGTGALGHDVRRCAEARKPDRKGADDK